MFVPITLLVLSTIFYIFYLQRFKFVYRLKEVIKSNDEKNIYNLSDVITARSISCKLLTVNYILLIMCFVLNVIFPTTPTSIGMLLFSNIIFYIAIVVNVKSLKYMRELYIHLKSNNLQDILYAEYFWNKSNKSEEELSPYKQLAEILSEIETIYSEIYTEEIFHEGMKENRRDIATDIINIKRIILDEKDNLYYLSRNEELVKELNTLYTDIKQLSSKYHAIHVLKPFKLLLNDLEVLLNKLQKC